jgi:hypothetical protein
MRANFAKHINKRSTFIGTFEKVGAINWGNMKPEKTFCIQNIVDLENNIMEQHVWLKSKVLDKLNLKKGDVIKFKARIKAYNKYSYNVRGTELIVKLKIDYKLNNPSKIIKIIGSNPIKEETNV